MTHATDLEAAEQSLRATLQAKGLNITQISIQYRRGLESTPWYVFVFRPQGWGPGTSLGGYGQTLAEAVGDIISKLAALPHRWTDAEVAATLGLGQ